MTNLPASHLAILASACSRDDALVVSPNDLKPAAAAKTGAKLVKLGLIREVRAKGDMPVWREDEQGHATSLKILKAGRVAVQAMTPAPEAASTSIGSVASVTPQVIAETQAGAAKAGSERAMILTLLSRDGGAGVTARNCRRRPTLRPGAAGDRERRLEDAGGARRRFGPCRR